MAARISPRGLIKHQLLLNVLPQIHHGLSQERQTEASGETLNVPWLKHNCKSVCRSQTEAHPAELEAICNEEQHKSQLEEVKNFQLATKNFLQIVTCVYNLII